MVNIEFKDTNFDTEVLKSNIPVLIDFWAPWCGPCRIQGPIIEELSSEYKNKSVKIGAMNVDENPEVPQKYGIMSIPTLILFKGGEPAEQLVGLRSKDELKRILDKYLL